MDKEIPKNRDITYFAKTNFRSSDSIFGIKRKDRRQHMYILGKSGTGKSVLMSNLIAQNIENGEGVCVVDPHGELVEEILHLIPDHRVKDVIYFNPADTDFHIGFNVIALDDPKYKHLVASGLMGIFTKIWANAWSSRMEYILNNSILALLDTPGTTLLGIPRLLVDKDYRQMIIGNLKDPVVKAFWVHEYEQWREQFRNEAIAPIQNKVGQFLSTSIIRNVVGQAKSTIDIFDIMNEGKIFLVNVSKGRIGEDNSALLGGMIITKIQLAAMERVRIPEEERKDFYLYVDEFQNFATDSFANILSEARKYRLNLIVAHQYTAQLENKDGSKVRDAVFGNVGTMIIFRVGADDADFLEKEFEPEFTAQDLVNLPNFHVYLKLMIDGITSRPFSATTLPPIKINVALGVKEKIIESSRANYARPREEVEAAILKWSGTLQVGDGDAKYKADCSNCGKIAMVPFEPKEGKPVYCKDCMYKIKSGELTPQTGFVASRSARQEEKTSTSPLAMLGIEYKMEEVTAPKMQTVNRNTPYTNKDKKERTEDKRPIINNTESKTENKKENIQSRYDSVTKNTYNNNSNFNKDQIKNSNFSQNKARFEKKYHAPSPLLKDLLNQIQTENSIKTDIKESIVPESKVEENKNKIKETLSLSSLKMKQDEKNRNQNTKEASEEHKASLRELLEKIENEKKQLVEKVDSKIEEKIVEQVEENKYEVLVPEEIKEDKKEEVFLPQEIKEIIIEEKEIPEVKIQEELKQEEVPDVSFDKHIEKEEEKEDEDPVPTPPHLNNTNTTVWQKRKVEKEVPEEVLLKVLE